MRELNGYAKTDVPIWKKYRVYELKYCGEFFVGETIAKSPEQAVNNVRWKNYGRFRYNDDFIAKEITEKEEKAI